MCQAIMRPSRPCSGLAGGVRPKTAPPSPPKLIRGEPLDASDLGRDLWAKVQLGKCRLSSRSTNSAGRAGIKEKEMASIYDRPTGWYRELQPGEKRTFWACFGGWTLDAMDVQI